MPGGQSTLLHVHSRWQVSCTVAVLCALAALLARAPTAAANPSGTLSMTPASMSVQAGDNLFITVDVNGGANIHEVEFALSFDPNVVQAMDADPIAPGVQILAGSFPGPPSEGTVLQNAVNAGVIHYAYALNPGGVRSGSGTAATVQFVALANGDAKLTWLAHDFIDNAGSAITPAAAPAQLFVGSAAPAASATSVPTSTATASQTASTATGAPTSTMAADSAATATSVPTSAATASLMGAAATDTPTATATAIDAAATSTATATATATKTPVNSPTSTRTPAPTSTARATTSGGTPPPASLVHVPLPGQGDPSRIKGTSELPAAGASQIGTAWWRWTFFLAALLLGIAGWFFTFAFHHGQKEVIIVDRFDQRRPRRR
jgi:hypothetical protein